MPSAERIQNVLAGASELPVQQRAAYLDAACGGDAALRQEVESLLKSHDEMGQFLADPTANVPSTGTQDPTITGAARGAVAAATVAGPLREGPGTRIGPYKILQVIGEGGFGSVFMAQQEHPVQRRVALKIIKLGMDTRQVIARFEQERQALAILDHPSIAKVFDAGTTDTGRPYFVMELCTGEPIDDYCDRHNLSIPERLQVFAQVCQAVQHAHTKGIIHRDIKPSNVLVALLDGRPQAKVIDFGIAKATSSRLTDKTLFTEHKQIIGTPEYMSPEQAEGSLDIDTRTDVYALGVMLYELLTGSTPFTSQELRSAAYAEIQRIIREVDPPRPSTRLAQHADTLASVAARRNIEPRKLGTVIRGELDWIVMKALEKDRARRYESASGLMMDIQRYLVGEAVVAAPPSAAYRFKKFIQRNRVAVTAGGAVAAALLVGAVAFAWQAKVASEQRDVAIAAKADALTQQARAQEQEGEARKQEALAKTQKGIAEGVVKFQSDMLAAVDPANLPKDPETGEPLKDKVTVVQALEAALKAIHEGSLKDSPLVEAGVLTTIGDTFTALGRYEDAVPVLRRALEIRKAQYPEGSPEIAQSLDRLADPLSLLSKNDEAEQLLREALAIHRRALPPGDSTIATEMNNLAQVLLMRGAYDEAEAMLREAVQMQDRLPNDPSIARTYDNLAKTLTKLNKLDEAEKYMRLALRTRIAKYPPGHPEIALGQNNLATMLTAAKKYEEAEKLYRESLAIERATLSAQHPEIANTLNNLGSVLKNMGKLEEAEVAYREALAIKRASLPRGSLAISTSLNGLAMLLKEMNKLEEAEPLYREALAIRRESLPPGHPSIAAPLNNLAVLLKDQGKLEEAEPLYRESLAIRRESLPAGHPSIAVALNNLAVLLSDQNKFAEAEVALKEALEIRRAALPAGSAEIANTLSALIAALLERSQFAEAEPLAREAVEIYRATPPAGNEKLAGGLSNLARVQQGLGQTAEARATWDKSIAMLRKRSPEGSALLARALWRSGSARMDNNDAAAALPELEEAVAMAEKFLKPDNKQLQSTRAALEACRAKLAQDPKATK